MTFAAPQIRKLKAKLRPQNVKMREADGISLSYLEGWHVLAEANRIFGFDGWDRESVTSTCVWTKQLGSRFAAAYVTRVRITVQAGDHHVVREGCGAGESNAATPGQAHEFAAKAAETDATKRALSTFGNAFGLSLYGGSIDRIGGKSNKSAELPPEIAIAGSLPEAEIAPASSNSIAPNAEGQQDARTPHKDLQIPTESSLPQHIDKSVLAIPELKRLRDKDHLQYVASQPCLVCDRKPAQAHHLKFSQPTAMGRKVSDEFTVPLCATHHRDLHHGGNELKWWEAKKIDPLPTAVTLWNESHGWP
jgi:DNA recombination protein Rad52